MPVGRLLKEVSSKELTEWIAYYRIVNEEMRQQRLDARARAGLAEARRLQRVRK